MVPYNGFEIPNEISHYTPYIINGNLFLDTEKIIYCYNGKSFEEWARWTEAGKENGNLGESYIDKDYLYYFTEVSDNNTNLCRYNVVTKKVDTIESANVTIFTGFVAHNDSMFFLSESGPLYKADFTDKSLTNIFDSGMMSFNIFDDNIYVSVQTEDESGGIYISESGADFKKISDKGANSLYILDDKYVYYTEAMNDEGHLYRVTIDGQTTEKVF